MNQISLSGLWRNNPALIQLLGLCPLLAVSNSTVNAFSLGVVTLFTLIISNLLVAAIRYQLPAAIRIPLYVLIIATTVSALELLIRAWFPELNQALGIFLPLVVTNCLIIGRAEAFASRHNCVQAVIDAVIMGLGFLWVITALGAVRELIGQGTLLSDAHMLFGDGAKNWGVELFNTDSALLIAILPPGAFLALGFMVALKNAIDLTGGLRSSHSPVSTTASSEPLSGPDYS